MGFVNIDMAKGIKDIAKLDHEDVMTWKHNNLLNTVEMPVISDVLGSFDVTVMKS